MNVVITKEKLKEGVDAAFRLNIKHESLPILKNVLIQAEKGVISLIATNLEIALTYTLAGKVIENGKITVPGQLLSQLVGSIQQERLNLSAKGTQLEISTDNYSAKVQGMEAEDFPIVPRIKNDSEFLSFSGEILKSAFEKVISATQFSDLRPELNGVLFTFGLDSVTLAGTDSFRLAEKKIQEQFFTFQGNKEFQLLVPLRTIHEIMRIVSDKDEVKMYHDENQILFATDKWKLISRLLEGTFPDYHTVVPKGFDAELELQKEEFMNAVKTVSVFGTKHQEIYIRKGEQKKMIEIFSRDEALGENTYLVPAVVKGDLKETSFSWRYLLDGLLSLEGKEIFFGINEDNKPALLRSPNDKSFFYLLMPIVKR